MIHRTQSVVVGKGLGVSASVAGDDHANEICDLRTKQCGAKDNNYAASSSTIVVTALHHSLG